MIKTIRIKNFILYENIEINPSDNLTMIIGDSASGKSLMFKALNIFSHNNKFDLSFLKNNKKECLIELIIDANQNKEFNRKIKELNIKLNSLNEVSFKNIFYPDNKKAYLLNEHKLSKKDALSLTSTIFNILNQNTTSKISNTEYITETIDFLDPILSEIKNDYQNNFNDYNIIKDKINSFEKQLPNLDEQIEFYESKLAKFDVLKDTSLEELETLHNKYQDFKNVLENKELYSKTLNIISNDNESISDPLYVLKNLLNQINKETHSEKVNEFIDYLDSIYVDIEKSLSEYEFDENEILHLKESSNQYTSIINKFGQKDDVNNEIKRLKEEIEILKSIPEQIEELKYEKKIIENKLNNLSNRMDKLREPIIKRITKNITSDIKEMGMKNSKILFSAIKNNDYTKHGMNTYKIKIKTTIQGNFLNLEDIASGGELSRLMLSFFKNTNNNSVFLFDEVDTGLSGEISFKLGKIIKNLSIKNQVICITHLTQVACFADQLYYVEKQEKDNTYSKFIEVSKNKYKDYLSKLLIESKESVKLIQDLLSKVSKINQ